VLSVSRLSPAPLVNAPLFRAQMKPTAAINILRHFLRNLFRAWVEIAIAFNCSNDFVLAAIPVVGHEK
jgi:hypothetical protein